MTSTSFSRPVRFLGMIRLPDRYFFLFGQRFSFIQSGISETASRERTFILSVLAIARCQIRLTPRSRYGCARGCQSLNCRLDEELRSRGDPGSAIAARRRRKLDARNASATELQKPHTGLRAIELAGLLFEE